MPPARKKKAIPAPGILAAAAVAPAPPREDGAATDPRAPVSVEAALVSLRSEVASLKQENLALQSRLAAARAVPRSPEDFAAAVERAVDKLQGQLASMSNPVSNFAVKEFRLETQVVVEVTALGDVVYRFPGATEAPHPATLSRISLDLVPIPKTTTAGVHTADLFQPGTDLEGIEGLTPPFQALLHQNQIDTLADLVAVGRRARSAVELAALLQVDRRQLAVWLTSAELMTLRGIDGGRATVLALAGFGTLRALATVSPENLAQRFSQALQKSGRRDVVPIPAEEAAFLVRAARAYIGQREAATPAQGGAD